jgi:hypothetical protein
MDIDHRDSGASCVLRSGAKCSPKPDYLPSNTVKVAHQKYFHDRNYMPGFGAPGLYQFALQKTYDGGMARCSDFRNEEISVRP